MAKYLNPVCLFCTLCLLLGIVSLFQSCLGVYLTFGQPDAASINGLLRSTTDIYLFYILIIFMGLGLISLLLTIISIYSVLKQRSPIFLSILFVFCAIMNICLFVVTYLYYYFILPQVKHLLIQSLQNGKGIAGLDYLQDQHNCCGINNKTDYYLQSLNTDIPSPVVDPLPMSCCISSAPCWKDELNQTDNSTMIYPQGCYPFVSKYLSIELYVLMAAAALCALFQFIGVTLFCALHHRYKKQNDEKFIQASSQSNQTIEETVEITQI